MTKLEGKKILLTGATGGIGSRLATQLFASGSVLALSSRSLECLSKLAGSIDPEGHSVTILEKDLLGQNAGQQLVTEACDLLNGLDIVINLAGAQTFKAIEALSQQEIDRQIEINLAVPIRISHAATSLFKAQGSGSIVNIGSAFGSIGFAQYSIYCATKFGLRGFSEALRRELHENNIKVIYIAPRATRTSMNTAAVYEMASVTGTVVDDPSDVAGQIIQAIRKEKPNTHIGLPEKIFSKLNGLFPGLIDKALSRQSRLAQSYANPDVGHSNLITNE
jgi:short-subunit dehydrogenase